MIDVIIPIFNRQEYTEVMLKSLIEADSGESLRLILVDNGSRRKAQELIFSTAEAAKQKFGDAQIVTLLDNRGTAAAYNAGLAQCKNEFIVFLHNDTILFPGWAKELLLAFTKSDEDIAIAVPRTNYANEGSPCIPELRTEFLKIKPSNKERFTPEKVNDIVKPLYGEDRNKFLSELREKVQLPYTYSPEISSFCMMIRKEMFDKYGKFDEDFWPRGYEDKLWFRSLERDGYVCMIANRAFVHHFGNITSDGPGFSFPDVMKINEEKYKAKCLERDKKLFKPTTKTTV